MKIKLAFLSFIIILGFSNILQAQKKTKKMSELPEGLYAKMQTNQGDIVVKLFPEKAPLTVANFTGLAEGVLENTAKPVGQPFYDGLIFHRVIKNFMIQGGDPNGTGNGGPGYTFGDEIDPTLKHDKKGILSMANAGPNTNGSQFFITEVPTPWLDGKHTVFGEVVQGLDVIDKIIAVEKDAGERPVEDVVLEKVSIVRSGDKYKSYDPKVSFDEAKENYDKELEKKKEMAKAEVEKQMQQIDNGFKKTESGLRYRIDKKNNSGKQIEQGSKVILHYEGKLTDGKMFDSSRDRTPIGVVIGENRFIPGLEEGLQHMKEGESATFLIPPDLAYGEQGVPGVIPANAILEFEIDALKVE